jgi:hypothetical protein
MNGNEAGAKASGLADEEPVNALGGDPDAMSELGRTVLAWRSGGTMSRTNNGG